MSCPYCDIILKSRYFKIDYLLRLLSLVIVYYGLSRAVYVSSSKLFAGYGVPEISSDLVDIVVREGVSSVGSFVSAFWVNSLFGLVLFLIAVSLLRPLFLVDMVEKGYVVLLAAGRYSVRSVLARVSLLLAVYNLAWSVGFGLSVALAASSMAGVGFWDLVPFGLYLGLLVFLVGESVASLGLLSWDRGSSLVIVFMIIMLLLAISTSTGYTVLDLPRLAAILAGYGFELYMLGLLHYPFEALIVIAGAGVLAGIWGAVGRDL